MLAAVMAWRLQAIDRPPFDPYQFDVQSSSDLIWSGGPNIHDRYISIGSWTINLDWFPIWKFYWRWHEIVGILLCMIAARSFAMAFNRLADRRIDAGNPRTAGRHLPAGILSVAQVTAFAAICA